MTGIFVWTKKSEKKSETIHSSSKWFGIITVPPRTVLSGCAPKNWSCHLQKPVMTKFIALVFIFWGNCSLFATVLCNILVLHILLICILWWKHSYWLNKQHEFRVALSCWTTNGRQGGVFWKPIWKQPFLSQLNFQRYL